MPHLCIKPSHVAVFSSGDSTGFIIQSKLSNNELGTSVAGAGDVNGDGYADVLVAAHDAYVSTDDGIGKWVYI
jgi:hypothetical protein